MNREERIMKRLKEHYNYLENKGHEVVAVMLQGSQNYNLDMYTDEYMSDIDSKAIVLPSFDDFVYDKKPFNYTYILGNEEHIDTKDIRSMCEMWRKENISYIELLYTDFKIINPKYLDILNYLISQKDTIVNINKNQFLRCIAGMAKEKYKALAHPYPSKIELIKKYGYDPKQLHHLLRLKEFISRYVNNEPLSKCYKAENKKFLMALKQGKSWITNKTIPAYLAFRVASCTVEEICEIKNKECTREDIINTDGIDILNRVRYNLLKRKFKKDLQDY